ncbi:Glycosyltransferase involved in cell wall bisynthesis [Marivirga sericea]|uniref:Glycosyltransferase involved in cell wall bisynthesis n=1 Tax=Marivirga sericea TaxID=1028 RepID=A0A1X7I9H4_9BACT|nr:glycosyltransferase family 4 protein [Marivirga sericea]SMG11333.1 Glycosyltransferase involved in cell wall bisynthesis [Marivirga sericea]
MRIFAAHLFNDYSGSPKVLMQLIKSWVDDNHEVHLYTCSGREGFLSHLNGVQYHFYWYSLSSNPYIRLLFLMASQFILMAKILMKLRKDDLVYVNTALPFGAAIAAKMKGAKLVYHVHETSLKPEIFKSLVFGIMKWSADHLVFVSDYLAKEEAIGNIPYTVIHNAIPEDFLEESSSYEKEVINQVKHVLMVCSLKWYKGVNEFLELAKSNPRLEFRLVLNAEEHEIAEYFSKLNVAENIEILSTQTNLHPHYQWAHIIVNLSRADGWIETFGLTIIEGMAYGLPAMIPTVGGITELVVDGTNGYQVDSRNIDRLNNALCKMTDLDHYQYLSNMASQQLNSFRELVFKQKSRALLELFSK